MKVISNWKSYFYLALGVINVDTKDHIQCQVFNNQVPLLIIYFKNVIIFLKTESITVKVYFTG